MHTEIWRIDGPMSRSVTIVYNPMAGRFNPRTLAALVAGFEGTGCNVSCTTTEIDGPISFPENGELICVMGGDGALRLVLDAMLKQNIQATICIFPGGTINLAARELKYPRKPDKFAKHIIARMDQNQVRNMPILMSDLGPIICSFSAGPDAQAVHNVSEKLKSRIGRLAYAVAVLKLLRSWPDYAGDFVITCSDGRKLEMKGGAVFLAKGLYYAGPFSFAPHASLTNHRFHLLLFPKFKRLQFVRLMWILAIRGNPDRIKDIQQVEAKQLEIKSPADFPCQIDGDKTERTCRRIWMSETNMPIVV